MTRVDKKFDIPTVTLLTAFLFVSTYSFKFGESLFFGYPIYYLSLDLSEVINSSLKVLFFMFFYCSFSALMVMGDEERRYMILKYLTIGLFSGAVVSCYVEYRKGTLDFIKLFSTVFVFFMSMLTFYLLSKSYKRIEGLWHLDWRYTSFSAMSFIVFCCVLGANYHQLPLQKPWFDKDGGFVVSQYKDCFLIKNCTDGVAHFKFVEFKDSEFYQGSFRQVQQINLKCED